MNWYVHTDHRGTFGPLNWKLAVLHAAWAFNQTGSKPHINCHADNSPWQW